MKSLLAPTLVVPALAALGFGFGCGPLDDAAQSEQIKVQPRVVLDGLFELGARTQGDVVIEEFVLHAGSVTATDALGVQLTVDEEALLFRYDLTSGGTSNDARVWNLHDGLGEVSVNVSPFEDETRVPSLTSVYDVDLNGLVGNAGLMRGFVLVERGTRELVAQSSKETRVHAAGDLSSGDPDGLPARSSGDLNSGDPDGLPAKTGGESNSGDPDGLPAKEHMSGDPDGLPAKSSGDPDGLPAHQFSSTKASGDPDGLPADCTSSGDPDGLPARSRAATRTLMSAPETQLVPFVVVFREPMGLTVPIGSLMDAVSGLATIDLHFDVSTFLDEEMLAAMTANDEEQMVIRASSSLFTVEQSELAPGDDLGSADDAPSALSNLSRRD